jgi:hypothetical protein
VKLMPDKRSHHEAHEGFRYYSLNFVLFVNFVVHMFVLVSGKPALTVCPDGIQRIGALPTETVPSWFRCTTLTVPA